MLLSALAWRCVQAKCMYFSSPEGVGGGRGGRGEGGGGWKGGGRGWRPWSQELQLLICWPSAGQLSGRRWPAGSCAGRRRSNGPAARPPQADPLPAATVGGRCTWGEGLGRERCGTRLQDGKHGSPGGGVRQLSLSPSHQPQKQPEIRCNHGWAQWRASQDFQLQD
jgi:hypothetical protein